MAVLQSRPMLVFHPLTGDTILVFANGRIIRIPPNPPPPLRELQQAAKIVVKAKATHHPADLVKLGRTERALIRSKLAEIQELVQQQVAVQEREARELLDRSQAVKGRAEMR